MPPLFVDGVEINQVFVDGIEQQNVFADGIEVFTAFEPENLFDDFGRSANGTLIQNHPMNTGHSWVPDLATGFLNGAIQSFQGQQGSFVTQVSNIAPASQVMEPVFNEPFPEAFVARMVGRWTRTDVANNTYINLEMRAADNVARNIVRYTFNIDGGDTSALNIFDESEIHQTVPALGVNTFATLELFYDSITYQARVTRSAGGVTITDRFPVSGIMSRLRVGCQEQFFGNQTKNNSISEFELEEFRPQDVPWPS